jgi:putative chromate ion transporter
VGNALFPTQAAQGAGDHTWRAYLSIEGSDTAPTVNARDLIGGGPWYNANGDLIAQHLAQLHSIFGGGHVVLPLLREAFVTPGWVSDDAFLAGYGAAQAVPGPLFTFAAYLGTVVNASPHGLAGAALGLVGIFLPGVLILIGTLPFWDAFRKRADSQAMMRGVNAAVVGLLGAALYNPVWTTSVKAPGDFAIALVGFVLLTAWRAPPLLVVEQGVPAIGKGHTE